MFQDTGMVFCYAESPLHAGSGSSVSAIDLPIQREAHTEFPIVQSSGWKGALRDECRQAAGINSKDVAKLKELRKAKPEHDKEKNEEENEKRQQDALRLGEKILPWEIVFGPDTDLADEHGGSLALTDVRLLLFPVRSLVGVFAWITCPLVIERFRRDLARVSETVPDKAEIDALVLPALEENQCWVCRKSDVRLNEDVNHDVNEIILEDFSFESANHDKPEAQEQLSRFGKWLADHAVNTPDNGYLASRLNTGLVLVSDTVFRDFVRHSTEVVTRICVNDETGTVEGGALWNVENLPTDCLLYSLALAINPPPVEPLWKQIGITPQNGRPEKKLSDLGVSNPSGVLATFRGWLDKIPLMQIGGDQSVGRGLITIRYLSSAKDGTASRNQPELTTAGQATTGE